jgi:hypothetical protein
VSNFSKEVNHRFKDREKYSLGELEVIYDNMDEKTQKWMLDNLYLWFGKEKPH